LPSPPAPYDLLLTGGRVLTPGGDLEESTVAVADGRIAALGVSAAAPARERISVAGLVVLPGALDTQVHFREPGFPEKETLADGTRAAALGGLVGVFEMPNTMPPTTGEEALRDKLARARGRAWVDHAFYVGAAPDNLGRLADLERLPGCCGVKMFMGSSTGTLLVADDESMRAAVASGSRRMAVHSEDEERLRERRPIADAAAGRVALHAEWRDAETAARATRRLLAAAREFRRPVHVLHVSTGDEILLLAEARDVASAEATPQHLTLSAPECYERLGAFAQMNPPIRDASHREALWRGVRDGVIRVVGSDHAPHTRAEKEREYPGTPSGMPGVQTLLPVMLEHVAAGRLSMARLAELTSIAPARLFGISGMGPIRVGRRADLTMVDPGREEVISASRLSHLCGWTPFEGMRARGWPAMSVMRGRVLLRDGELQGEPRGEPLEFDLDGPGGGEAPRPPRRGS